MRPSQQVAAGDVLVELDSSSFVQCNLNCSSLDAARLAEQSPVGSNNRGGRDS
jgi:hypothetical protein